MTQDYSHLPPVTGSIEGAQTSNATVPKPATPKLFQLKAFVETLWRSGIITIRPPRLADCCTYTFNPDYKTGKHYPFIYVEGASWAYYQPSMSS